VNRRWQGPSIFLTHPFELCVAFAMLMTGVRALLASVNLSASVDRGVGDLMAAIWQFGIIAGSSAILLSLFARPLLAQRGERYKSIGRTVERVGLLFIATSCLVYAVVLVALGTSTSGFAIAITLGVGTACVLRSIALRRTDQAVIHQLRMLNGSDPYDDGQGNN
jgi:hypothetical protein